VSEASEQRPSRRRLFVAVDLDDAARAACAAVARRLRAAGWSGKWVAPENYHLTVAFLGAVDEARVAGVAAALREVAARTPSFEAGLNAVGAFPNARKARVAWVGPAARVPAFGTLCGAVRSALAALGFAFDRDAEPHVTLARADGRGPLPSVEPPDAPPLRVGALTLYQSFTEPSGARYVALERFPLAP
jgi:2'-5' RNA ligase